MQDQNPCYFHHQNPSVFFSWRFKIIYYLAPSKNLGHYFRTIMQRLIFSLFTFTIIFSHHYQAICNSGITPEMHADTALYDSEIYYEQAERVLIHLQNIPIGSQKYPGSSGIVKLERKRYRQQSTTLDNMAGFFDVPVAAGYTVTGIHRSKTEAFGEVDELWGIWKNMSIKPNQTEFTFTREMPYIFDIQVYYQRENTANPSLQKSEELRFDILMHNPSQKEYRGTIKLLLKNTRTGNIHELEKDIRLAAKSKREFASIHFIAGESGEFHHAAGIFLKQRINQWTDFWDWSPDPSFFVSKEHRTLKFADYNWDVKAGFGNPGGNLWSNDTTDVWVDDNGHLHLTLSKKDNGRWYATEVISHETFNYGTYTFFIDADPSHYDPHVVAGIFLYRDEENEIDIEFSRWGDHQNYQYGNYVIQPAERYGNQFQFPILATGTYTTHQIIWAPGEVHFSSWHGHHMNPPDGNFIAQWHYNGENTPKPNGLRLFFNIWLFRGIMPKTDKTEKIIIKNFIYNPLTQN